MPDEKRIEVVIPNLDLARQGPSDAAKGAYIINRLKDAGIPVKGVITIQGATHGALTMFEDQMFGDLVIQWRSELPD